MSTDAEIRAVRIEEKRSHKRYRPPAPAPKHVVKPEKNGEVKVIPPEEFEKYKAFWEQSRLADKQIFEQYSWKEKEEENAQKTYESPDRPDYLRGIRETKVSGVWEP